VLGKPGCCKTWFMGNSANHLPALGKDQHVPQHTKHLERTRSRADARGERLYERSNSALW
jgi:hypothetical protein